MEVKAWFLVFMLLGMNANAQVTACAVIGGIPPACNCPTGYSPIAINGAQHCRPDAPLPAGGSTMSEFIKSTTSNFYPSCGSGRLPVKMISSTAIPSVYKFASSNVPRTDVSTTLTTSFGSITYPYTDGTTSARYLYSDHNRCVCSFKTWSPTPQLNGTSSLLELSTHTQNGQARILPDTFDVINSLAPGSYPTDSSVIAYAGVAIGNSMSIDGRSAMYYGNESKCGCPNFNEKMVQIDPTDPTPNGSKCIPAVAPHEARILVNFDPAIHDVANASQVMNRAYESFSADGSLVQKFLLPYGGSSPGATVLYDRKIWTCDPNSAFKLNTSTGTCETERPYHAAGPGNGSTIPASPVSPRVTGADPVAQFNNTINKKLAVCLNGFGSNNIGSTTGEKFDCVENPRSRYPDFNALWSSTDSPEDGGSMFAITLTNANGRVISGFYTLTGAHCSEFSEFAGVIQPGMVNPLGGPTAQMATAGAGADAFMPKGNEIATPGSGEGGGVASYNALKTKITGSCGNPPCAYVNKTVPTSTADRRRCPVLVRAAITTRCPENTAASPLRTYEVMSGGVPVRRQCSAADDIQVHLRIEQIWEIAGQPKLPTFDTIAGSGDVPAISIQRIIGEKWGLQCPSAGMTRNAMTGACEW